MKTGLFGGTFNPIHNGHINLAMQFAKKLKLDKVIFMPNNTPPHKEADDLASGDDRLKMCELAVYGSDGFEVSDFEIKGAEKSYTIDTLMYFKEKYPADEIYLIMGSDMFLTMERWRNWQGILKLCTLCAAVRDMGEMQAITDYANRLKSFGAKIEVIDIEPITMSSTDIRQRLMQGEFTVPGLAESVRKYILASGLYIGEAKEIIDTKRLVASMLSEYRYNHSLGVAREALRLAIMHGANEKKAFYAGLIHDIAKDMPKEKQLEIIKKAGVTLTALEKKSPKLWHAMAGSEYAKKVLGIKDEEILNAIRYHTTARDNSAELEMTVYLADFISADRDYPEAKEIKKRANISLESGMSRALSYSIMWLAQEEKLIHPDSFKAYCRFCGCVG